MGRLFSALKWIYQRVTPKMTIEWAEPFIDEPCIFICNHAGAFGPIHMTITFPHCDKVVAWCNDGVLTYKDCVPYIRKDYWWPEDSKLAPLYNVTIPYAASAIMPPVLRSAPIIPVHHDIRVMTTMRQSVKALKAGKYVVIFPELPDGFDSHREEIQTGWMKLCVLYHRATGKALRMYPVYIDTKGHHFKVAKPVMYDPDRSLEEQEQPLCRILEAGIRGRDMEY